MILAAVCFAFVGIFVKLIGDNIHFMSLNFFRTFFGLLFLLIVVPFIDENALKVSKKDIKSLIFIGFILAVSTTLATTSILFAPIHNVVLIHYIYPFFLLIFSYFMLKEKITKTKVISLLIAFVGLAIINPFQVSKHLLGNSLALGGAFSFAILVAFMRKLNKTHHIGTAIWLLFFATIFLLPFPLIFGFGYISKVLGYLLLLGLVSTGLGFLLYNLALKKLEAEIAAIIATVITPLFSILLAVLVINEQLNFRIIIGGILLIISGIYLESHIKKTKPKKKKDIYSPVRVQ